MRRNRPHTVAELTSKAVLPSSSHGIKMWIRSALLLFEQGLDSNDEGSLEEGFVSLLKGVTIILEIVPALKDFDNNDKLYLSARSVIIALC